MTYKQKLEDQIEFAQKKKQLADLGGDTTEVNNWNGYIQGLRFEMSVVKISGLTEVPVENPVVVDGSLITKCPYPNECVYPNCKCQEQNQCQCSPTDLQPFGECVCGKMLN